jgi:hypothetical protein
MNEVSHDSNRAEQLKNLPLEPSKTNDDEQWQLHYNC